MANIPRINASDIERLMSREPAFPLAPFDDSSSGSSFSEMSEETPRASNEPEYEEPAEDSAAVAARRAEDLLRQAEMAVQSMYSTPTDTLPAGAVPYQLEELQGGTVTPDAANLDLIRDVELNLKIELGRTEMSLDDVLKLRRGSVVTLERQTGEPVDIYANGRLIARGEVLVLDDNFCVRVVELTSGTKEAA
jgi:flagellar motor switch protein FliN/FliY